MAEKTKTAAVADNGRNRLKKRYIAEILPALMKEKGYKNVNEVPKLEKIVLNMRLGDIKDNSKSIQMATAELEAICGQKAVIAKAKKSVANFKLREGQPIGIKVTLRGNRMYEFFDKLVSIALPRVRDFRGISGKSFDGRGNYALGIKEQIIFRPNSLTVFAFRRARFGVIGLTEDFFYRLTALRRNLLGRAKLLQTRKSSLDAVDGISGTVTLRRDVPYSRKLDHASRAGTRYNAGTFGSGSQKHLTFPENTDYFMGYRRFRKRYFDHAAARKSFRFLDSLGNFRCFRHAESDTAFAVSDDYQCGETHIATAFDGFAYSVYADKFAFDAVVDFDFFTFTSCHFT